MRPPDSLLIPSAKVSFEVWQGHQADANSLPLGQVAGDAATGVSNQIGQVLGTTELTDDEIATAPTAHLRASPRPSRSARRKWEVTSPTLDQALSEPAVVNWPWRTASRGGCRACGCPPPGPRRRTRSPPALLPGRAILPVTVDAGWTRLWPEGRGQAGKPRVRAPISTWPTSPIATWPARPRSTPTSSSWASSPRRPVGPGALIGGLRGRHRYTGAAGRAAPPRFDHYYLDHEGSAGVKVTKLSDGSLTVGLSLPTSTTTSSAWGMKSTSTAPGSRISRRSSIPGSCSKSGDMQQTSPCLRRQSHHPQRICWRQVEDLPEDRGATGRRSWTQLQLRPQGGPGFAGLVCRPGRGTRHLDCSRPRLRFSPRGQRRRRTPSC